MWRSVLLLNEFPDHDVRSLQGLPGSLSPGSPALNPSDGAVLIAPGRSLSYVLDTPLEDVVGLSCRLRIRQSDPAVTSSLPILRLGDSFDLRLEPLTAFQALVRVRLRRVWHDIGQLPNSISRFVELRFDWHTSGKTFLRVDGRLVGYHDALSRGSRLTIGDITFGSAGSLPTTPDQPYQLGEFYVRALSPRTRWSRRRTTAQQ